MTKLLLKTTGKRAFHEYDSLEDAVSAGKILNLKICMSIGVTDCQTWIDMCFNDEMPRFYIETEKGFIACNPEF